MIRKKPANWLTIDETVDYVRKEHNRRWSRTNIYSFMYVERLPYFKVGASRIVLKKDIDTLIKTFTKPTPRWKSTAEGRDILKK